MPSVSLRTKLLGAVLIVLLPVATLFVYDYYSDLTRSTTAVLDSQLQTAQTVAVLVDAEFRSLEDIAWAFSKDPVVLTFDPARIDPYLRQFEPLFPLLSNIAVFASDGRNVGSMRDLPTPRPGAADREYFQAVMATNVPYISNVLVSRATGEPIELVAVPIQDDQSRPIGVVFASLDLEFFPDVLAPVQLQPGQHIFIADRTGRLAFHTDQPELTWEERDASSHPAVREALSTGQFRGLAEHGIVLPEARLIAATQAPESGWVAGVSVTPQVALAAIEDALRIKTLGYFAILVVSVLGALALAEQVLRPLRRLAENAIALGRGELDRRVRIKTGDELETVGDAFNAMAEEVQRALRLRDDFMTIASHELRTPLTTIRGYAQLLLRKATDESDRKALEAIIRSTERMDDLVQDMLEITRIRQEGVRLHEEKFNLAERVQRAAERQKRISPKHRLVVRVEGPVEVNADPDKIDLVLINLIDNAIRYSPAGGDVEIEVGGRDGTAVVTVIDHGLGIPREKQRHILEPFFQVYPAIAGFGGMGLGLYISKQIVEAHQGTIWFESEEGKGSRFHFSLPLH